MKITGKLRAWHIILGKQQDENVWRCTGETKEKDRDGKEQRDYHIYSYYVMSKPTHPSYDR